MARSHGVRTTAVVRAATGFDIWVFIQSESCREFTVPSDRKGCEQVPQSLGVFWPGVLLAQDGTQVIRGPGGARIAGRVPAPSSRGGYAGTRLDPRPLTVEAGPAAEQGADAPLPGPTFRAKPSEAA